MKIERRFTRSGADAYEGVLFALTSADAGDGEGSGAAPLVEVPSNWDPVAAAALAREVLCPRIPARLKRLRDKEVPEFLWASFPDGEGIQAQPYAESRGESSARQVFDRFAGAVTAAGWRQGHFSSDADARSFYDELRAMLAAQVAMPSAPLLASVGLDWAYGLEDALTPSLAEAGLLVVGDADLPGAEAIIGWKQRREHKIASMAVGSRLLNKRLQALSDAASEPGQQRLAGALRQARADGIPDALIDRALRRGERGASGGDFPEYDTDFDGEAALSLSGDLDRVALRLGDRFLGTVGDQSTAPEPETRLWAELIDAIWATGSPEIIFAENADAWADAETAEAQGAPLLRVRLNALAFAGNGRLDHGRLVHTVRLWTLALDILAGEFGGKAPARLSLEPTNIAGMLMALGLGYDSAAGGAMAGAVASIITGAAWLASADCAELFGPASEDQSGLLRLLGNHRHAAYGNLAGYDGLAHAPLPLDRDHCPEPGLIDLARGIWDDVLIRARSHGLRHAAVTGLFPAEIEDRLLGAASFGLAPLPGLVVERPEPEGGYLRQIAEVVPEALESLGYGKAEVEGVLRHILGHGGFGRAPAINHTALIGHGFGRAEIARIEAALTGATHIRQVFTPWILGEKFCREVLGIPKAKLADAGFDLLAHLGFTADEIEAASRHVLGAGTIEGAPQLASEHLAVFDCGQSCGVSGRRAISASAQIRLIAAVQGHLSLACQVPLMLAQSAAPQEFAELILLAQSLGLRGLCLQRRGSGLSQVLDFGADEGPLAKAEPLADYPAAVEALVSLSLAHGVPAQALSAILAENGLDDVAARPFAAARPGGAAPAGRSKSSQHSQPDAAAKAWREKSKRAS